MLRMRMSSDLDLVVSAHRLVLFGDHSCVLSPRSQSHSLQDVLVAYQKDDKTMPETLVMFYSLELLRALSALHGASLMHCNIHPANLIVRNVRSEEWEDWKLDRSAGWEGKGLALTEWSTAVDCKRSDKRAKFASQELPSAPCNASCMNELKGQVWTSRCQLDRWQAACVIHSMLFGLNTHLQLSTLDTGKRVPQEKFASEWHSGLWTTLFDALLNGDTPASELQNLIGQTLVNDAERVKSVKRLLCKQNILVCG